MVKLPCKDCQNRHPACHDSCEEYKLKKKEMQDMNSWLRTDKGTCSLSTKSIKKFYKNGTLNKNYGI